MPDTPKCKKPSYCWYIIKSQYPPNWYPPEWDQLSVEQRGLWNEFEQFLLGSWDNLTNEQVTTQLSALDTIGLAPLKQHLKAVLSVDHLELVNANLDAFEGEHVPEAFDLLDNVQDGLQNVLTETFQLADTVQGLSPEVLVNQASMRVFELLRPEITRVINQRIGLVHRE